MGRTTRPKINIEDLNKILDQMDITDIFSTL